MVEETANRMECEDTKEMVQWRSITQEGIIELWKELCGNMEEEEVMEEYRVDGAQKVLVKGEVSR